MSVREPTVDKCDSHGDEECLTEFLPLSELPYCQQFDNSSTRSSSYRGKVLPCKFFDGVNAAVISDTSVALITGAALNNQQRLCNDDALDCPRVYNQSRQENFYVAQSEDFLIFLDHVASSPSTCTDPENYRCGIQSMQPQSNARLRSESFQQCQEEERVYKAPRGSETTSDAPCYIEVPEIADSDRGRAVDVFTVEALLLATGASLDDCVPDQNEDNDPCLTYRETGATILLDITWNDFDRGKVDPYYFYTPKLLVGSAFESYIPFYYGDSFPNTRTLLDAHGVRVTVLLGGAFHSVSALALIITLFTAFGLLKITKFILDKAMTVCLKERAQYKAAKFEDFQLSSERDQNEEKGDAAAGDVADDVETGIEHCADAKQE